MRGLVRLHVAEALGAGITTELSEAQAHHLRHVMRTRDGEAVALFNGRDGEWRARLVLPGRHGARATIEVRLREQHGEPPWVTLLVSPAKREAAELAVRMATELGVAAIRPVVTERCVARMPNLERWGAIAREAAEQSERLTVPTLSAPVGLPELLDGWTAGMIAAALERRGRRLLGTDRTGPNPTALLVGPEGGFTEAELDALGGHPFVQPVSLGSLVLRADTAVAAGLALLRAEHRTDQD